MDLTAGLVFLALNRRAATSGCLDCAALAATPGLALGTSQSLVLLL
jgi:hypothetical protein